MSKVYVVKYDGGYGSDVVGVFINEDKLNNYKKIHDITNNCSNGYSIQMCKLLDDDVPENNELKCIIFVEVNGGIYDYNGKLMYKYATECNTRFDGKTMIYEEEINENTLKRLSYEEMNDKRREMIKKAKAMLKKYNKEM